jgi:hypothetical protein
MATRKTTPVRATAKAKPAAKKVVAKTAAKKAASKTTKPTEDEAELDQMFDLAAETFRVMSAPMRRN